VFPERISWIYTLVEFFFHAFPINSSSSSGKQHEAQRRRRKLKVARII